ncbi:Asparagine--tRNA ligase, cytoplasmic 1 [Platanthera guangdongensis]|uniref:Asparagine--tRNA ligase, cytoplasmic 1 n=1 Tax=Platanthera guangdongensis TaxID=2320717 RepID=A0ABR2MU57_9ASPA
MAKSDGLAEEVSTVMAATSISDPALERSHGRIFIKTILNGAEEFVGRRLVVGGWVKTGREQGKGSFAFLELNDGSCLANLQVIVDAAVFPLAQLTATGTCVLVEGELKKPPEGVKQNVELRVEKVLEMGPVDPSKYPLPKTRLTLEFLRDFVHFRARTNTISSVARIRHELAYATHTFFRENGFRYVHTPIITTSDCEGAGEMFQVTTLFSEAEKIEKELKQNPPPQESDIESAKLLVKEKGESVFHLKSLKATKEEIAAGVAELTKAKESLTRLEERFNMKGGIPRKDGKIDYALDFFGRQSFLTVSGQLQVETYACALGNVYTFGPTFRAEHSHTSRHLAEFWMVEPEIAFANLEDDMNYAESYVKFLCKWLLDHCIEDMEFMVKNFDKTAIERLKLVTSHRLSEFLTREPSNFWKTLHARNLRTRYLTEVIFKKPVIVYNYPKSIKAFYMRLNDDEKTVAAMDVLVPKVGELIGGSQREERLDVLIQRSAIRSLYQEKYNAGPQDETAVLVKFSFPFFGIHKVRRVWEEIARHRNSSAVSPVAARKHPAASRVADSRSILSGIFFLLLVCRYWRASRRNSSAFSSGGHFASFLTAATRNSSFTLVGSCSCRFRSVGSCSSTFFPDLQPGIYRYSFSASPICYHIYTNLTSSPLFVPGIPVLLPLHLNPDPLLLICSSIAGLPLEPYEWYLDLRRFGTVKHSGFGLGFERMVLFATGLDNIRDVIPFPRYPGRADL